MNYRYFAILGVVIQTLFGCAADSFDEYTEPTQGWTFNLSNGSFRLTDSDQQAGDQLRAQISVLYSLVQGFQDPAIWNSHRAFFSESWKSHLTISTSQGNQTEFEWFQYEHPPSLNYFAHCSIQQRNRMASVPCDTVALLNCLNFQVQSSQSSEGSAGSGLNRSLLLSGLKECGMSTEILSRTSPEYKFSIKAGEVQFSPSPAFSLLIYPGLWSSYEDANVQSISVASFSEPLCSRADAACLRSPLTLASCQGCEQLEKGQLYTVFFIESLRQNYDVVKSVPYIH
jgi:hypothetical protein